MCVVLVSPTCQDCSVWKRCKQGFGNTFAVISEESGMEHEAEGGCSWAALIIRPELQVHVEFIQDSQYLHSCPILGNFL